MAEEDRRSRRVSMWSGERVARTSRNPHDDIPEVDDVLAEIKSRKTSVVPQSSSTRNWGRKLSGVWAATKRFGQSIEDLLAQQYYSLAIVP